LRYRNPVPIKMLGNRVATADIRTAQQPKKRADPELRGSEYNRWRTIVLDRAGHRCEWVEGGERCTKAEPAHTLFADHIVERQDGGALHDPANGQALCGSHHSRKTAIERARRMATPSRP
jgi:5-methylcytosine-specific restriction endonuclease McrA